MRHTRIVLVALILVTVVVGTGATMVSDDSSINQFETDSPEVDAQEYIQDHFVVETENSTSVQLIATDENVLTRESLRNSLDFQREIHETESINATLASEAPIIGLENIVATAIVRQQDPTADPTLAEQRHALETISEPEYEAVLTSVLSPPEDGGHPLALRLMPTEYDPGAPTAEARLSVLTQETDRGEFDGPGSVEPAIVETQVELQSLADDQPQSLIVFGVGVVSDELDRSIVDSIVIVAPLAVAFVIVALAIAYRDPLDIVLGLAGIFAVLVWTFGFMGWAGIAFNQLFVAIPVLLIGLSIDYAIHLFMRHREQRAADDGNGTVRSAMTVTLAGVGVALVWVTATAVIGFLSNVTSPIVPIQEFGIVCAVGIFAALIVFGTMVPAAKVELDTLLERRGYDRRRRAFGTSGGRFSAVLRTGALAAWRTPVLVIVIALLLAGGGVYSASLLESNFDDDEFISDQPGDWTDSLPAAISPGDYRVKDDMAYVNEHFLRGDTQAELLVSGDVTHDETLQRLARAEADAGELDIAYELPTGAADVRSPLSHMQAIANEDEEFNAMFTAADTDGDDIPDQNVGELYDRLYEIDAEGTGELVARDGDGEYEAVRLLVSVQGDASTSIITPAMRELAEDFTAQDDDQWEVVATGDPIVGYVVEEDLLGTVLDSLIVTLIAVFAFLTIAYFIAGNTASLGAITLLPVAFAVSWIFGTMYLLGMQINVMTGIITSMTVGLGVAYSIHVSARYTHELDRLGNVRDAMETTVTGTGGALLGSAATTVGGFGVLAFAMLPVLRQFGIITALAIVYAFLASVLILPSILVLWTRYVGPDVPFESAPTDPIDGSAKDRTVGANVGGSDR